MQAPVPPSLLIRFGIGKAPNKKGEKKTRADYWTTTENYATYTTIATLFTQRHKPTTR
jgi:hypothetical protein